MNIRYKCTELTRRSCGAGYVGDYVTRFCEECSCHKTLRGDLCFDSKGNSVSKHDFPFTSEQECRNSCVSEKCRPMSVVKAYYCNCTNKDFCEKASDYYGISYYSQECNCAPCKCTTNKGVTECKDPEGNICTDSLEKCQSSCIDIGCPSFPKWGCSRVEGDECTQKPPERELITKCVECDCKDTPTGVKCTPNSTQSEVNCQFDTIQDCENSRTFTYGFCKPVSCQKTNEFGIVNVSNLKIQAIPSTNLGIRKVNTINVLDVQEDIEESLASGTLYSGKYTFTNSPLPKETFGLRPNGAYLNIFNEHVSYVVKYFLDFRNEPSAEWSEIAVNEIRQNRSHLIESLDPDLNLIFNNLTYPTGMKVDPNHLYDGLIELLITGRLDEFDASFYKEVYKFQKELEIINYDTAGSDFLKREKIGLGIIADSLVSADPQEHTGDEDRAFDFISNTKAFLTDIDAYIPVIVDGSALRFDARDDGIVITDASGTDVLFPPGLGYGYYLPLTVPTDSGDIQIPLEFTTDLAGSFFVPLDALMQAAELMGENSIMKLSVSSLSGNNEFDTDYIAVSSTSAMYFALDLSAMTGQNDVNNKLLNKINAPYKLKTDSSIIEDHSIEAGTQVTEVYLHHDDPMWSYLLNTEYCELDLVNIDFTSFLDNKAPLNGERIVRGIVPRALIFVSSKGSTYTNFHSKSKIRNITKNASNNIIVTRDCELVSLLQSKTTSDITHALTRKYTFNEYRTYGIGLLGTKESNHDGGVFDVDKTFFVYDPSAKYDNVYYEADTLGYVSSVSSTMPSTTYLLSEVTKTITDNYLYSHLTWWDLFRRLKLFDYGALQIEMTQQVTNALESGLLINGTRVTYVKSEEDINNTGIVNPTLEVSGDTIILTEEGRDEGWIT